MSNSFYDDASLVVIPSGYKASKVYSQKPTDGTGDLSFTRALQTATRVGPDGLIEKVRTNVVLQSQTLDNASWIKDASSITANTIAAPDGTLTAETLTADGTAATHGIKQTGTATLTNGITYSTSIYAKKGTNDFFQIVGSSGPYVTLNVFANFDLNNGVVGTTGSSATASIEDVGNGWFRCTMVGTALATSSVNTYIIQIVSSASAARGESNSLSTSVFLWGAQLEVSDFGATPYIPTTTAAVSVGMLANVPRLSYEGGGCPKLLLEPQRTNLVTFSEQINNAAWIKNLTTVTANTATAPDGTLSADTILADGVSGPHLVQTNLISYTSATAASFSVFAKKGTNNFIQLIAPASVGGMFANFNIDTGVVGTLGTTTGSNPTSSITDFGNGWYRCVINFTPNATSGQVTTIGIVTSASAVRAESNTLATSIFLWGCQLEAGAYPTSYIPTLGAAVTRSADAASKTGISALIGQTEGTLFIDVNITKLVDSEAISTINSGGYANNTTISRVNSVIEFKRNSATQSGASVVNSSAIAIGRHKMAIAYKSGDTAFFLDGVQVSTTQTQTFTNGTLSVLSITGDAIGAIRFSDSYNQALLFKTRLTNAQLAELTA